MVISKDAVSFIKLRSNKSVFAAKRRPLFVFHKEAVHGGTIFLESKRSVSHPSGEIRKLRRRSTSVWFGSCTMLYPPKV